MNRLTGIVAGFGLAFVLVGLTGCGGSKNPAVAQKAFLGKWVQNTSSMQSQGGASGMQITEFKERWELTMDEGGTYTMTLTTLDGKPIEPAQSVQGTWKQVDKSIDFTVTSQNLDEEHKGWAPFRLIRLSDTEMDIRTDNSARLQLVRP